MERVLDALCAGRDRDAALWRLVVALGLAAILWVSACIFMLLEPAA